MNDYFYYTGGKWSYAITLFMLLLAFYTLPKHRTFTLQWRYSMYVLLFIVYACSFFYDCFDIYQYFSTPPQKYEGYDFYITRYNYGFSFWGYFLYKMCVLFAFALKMARQTFIWGMLMLVMAFYENILVWVTSFARDYLPSSWSISYKHAVGQILFSFIVFNIAIALVYLVRKAFTRFSTRAALL